MFGKLTTEPSIELTVRAACAAYATITASHSFQHAGRHACLL